MEVGSVGGEGCWVEDRDEEERVRKEEEKVCETV